MTTYPQAWIEKRLRSISVRGELTDEWKARGVAEGKEYSILTAEIARATFGITPSEHSQLKGLDLATPRGLTKAEHPPNRAARSKPSTELKTSLPSMEQIDRELSQSEGAGR